MTMNDERDEQLVVATRTHPKTLVGPILLGLVTVAVGIAVAMLVPAEGLLVWLQLALWILCGLVLLIGALIPVLRWRASTFTVTTQQIQTRTGVLTRSGSDIPLTRVAGVETERGLTDRIFGCGTLIVRDAGSVNGIALRDIPRVQVTRDLINDLVHGASGPR